MLQQLTNAFLDAFGSCIQSQTAVVDLRRLDANVLVSHLVMPALAASRGPIPAPLTRRTRDAITPVRFVDRLAHLVWVNNILI